MGAGLKERVQRRLDELGINPFEAARRGGLERTFLVDILKGKKASVRGANLAKLAKALDSSVAYLTEEVDSPSHVAATQASLGAQADVRRPSADEVARLPTRFSGPRDVPVLGIAVGGESGDFQLNGETIDYAPRPPLLEHRKDVFVLHAVNDSMYPVYRPGSPLYVDPHRAPAIGDDVIIELHAEAEGQAGAGFIKRLVRRGSTTIVVEQFNPPHQIEFDARQVKRLYRVIPYEELLGL